MNFKINKQKRICDLILIVLIILIYLFLGAVRVAPTKYMFKSTQREIDWTIFESKKVQHIEKNNNEQRSRINNQVDPDLENILIPSLDFLENESNSRLNLGRKKYAVLTSPPVYKIDNKIDVASTEKFTQISELNFKRQKTKITDHERRSNQYIEGPGIEIEEIPDVDLDVGTRPIQSRFDEIPDEKLIPEPETIKIELRTDEIHDDERDISPFINELIIWMKHNPYDFPDVIKRFMNYENGNLTSKVNVEIDGKFCEFYLLCKENILEVRICLVADENAILLIDSGFKEKSNYLRKGMVRRDINKIISKFITRQEAPSVDRTKEFYSIFLSWWGKVKAKTATGEAKK